MYHIFYVLFICVSINTCSAWQRTRCGPGDQVTKWGLGVNSSSVLTEYPRPRMVRPASTYRNLNGLWQFEPGTENQPPPFGKTLSDSILVPFPVESCLSGIGKTYKYLWYRLVVDAPFSLGKTLIHFGAVDWQSTLYVNTKKVGSHTGGYDAFSFDLTTFLNPTNNEILLYVFDPSDNGAQPNGKQRISAINDPGGDTYTPSSGIWQTVWFENVPSNYINRLDVQTDTQTVTATVYSSTSGTAFTFSVFDGATRVAQYTGTTGDQFSLRVPNAKLWSPSSPFLYTVIVQISTGDSIQSYLGMRSFTLVDRTRPPSPPTGPQPGIDRAGSDLPGYPVQLPAADPNLCWGLCNKTAACTAWAYAVPKCDSYQNPTCWLKSGSPGTSSNQCRVSGAQAIPGSIVKSPRLNNEELFLAGWLDQSWWPDGLYTAPSDDALLFDVQAVKDFGLNLIRLHQKVNSERWYWHADRLGVVVFQDMIQKYGGASAATVELFMGDLTAMINGRISHPSIVQWTAFNEGDCWAVFDVKSVVDFIKKLDSSRLVDTDSGGGANDFHYADVNDIHTYPYPGHPIPSSTQYGMVGEYGGIGAFVKGKEWVPGQCQTYLQVPTPTDEANTYIAMVNSIKSMKGDISACVYTQITDVERECDGFYNFDRTNKFSPADMQRIVQANRDLIG